MTITDIKPSLYTPGSRAFQNAYGTINFHVTDITGNSLPGAQVALNYIGTPPPGYNNSQSWITCDNNGNLSLDSMVEGYTIAYSAVYTGHSSTQQTYTIQATNPTLAIVVPNVQAPAIAPPTPVVPTIPTVTPSPTTPPTTTPPTPSTPSPKNHTLLIVTAAGIAIAIIGIAVATKK